MYWHLVSNLILKRKSVFKLKQTENVVKENQEFQIQDWVFDLMNK